MENIKEAFEKYSSLQKDYENSSISFIKTIFITAIFTVLAMVFIHWCSLFIGILISIIICVIHVKSISKYQNKAKDELYIVEDEIAKYLTKILGIYQDEFYIKLVKKSDELSDFDLHILCNTPTNYSNMIGILQRENVKFAEVFGDNFEFLIRTKSI